MFQLGSLTLNMLMECRHFAISSRRALAKVTGSLAANQNQTAFGLQSILSQMGDSCEAVRFITWVWRRHETSFRALSSYPSRPFGFCSPQREIRNNKTGVEASSTTSDLKSGSMACSKALSAWDCGVYSAVCTHLSFANLPFQPDFFTEATHFDTSPSGAARFGTGFSSKSRKGAR